MKTHSDIQRIVESFIRENFIFNPRKMLDENDSLIGTGVIDSTGVLELIEFLERTFGFHVEDDELVADNFDSLNKITAYLEKKVDKVQP